MSGNTNKRVSSLRLSTGNIQQRSRVTKSVSELNGFFVRQKRPSDPQVLGEQIEHSEPIRPHLTYLKKKPASHDADEFIPIRDVKKEKKTNDSKHRTWTGKRTGYKYIKFFLECIVDIFYFKKRCFDFIQNLQIFKIHQKSCEFDRYALHSIIFKKSRIIILKMDISEYPPDDSPSEPNYEIPIPDHETRYFNYKSHPLDDRQLQWIHPYCKGNSPSERKNHTAAIVNNSLYVMAGTDRENLQNQTYALDLSKLNFSEKIHNFLLIYYSQLKASYTWRQLEALGPVPPHRYGHSCTVVGTNLLVFGGRNKTMVLNDLYAFDTRIFFYFYNWSFRCPFTNFG